MVLALDHIGHDLLGAQIEWVENCIEKDITEWAAKCTDCKMREPTQSARTHAKYAGPRKVRGLRYECADAKCADAREMHGPRFKCAGRTECMGRNCVERWVGRTAQLGKLGEKNLNNLTINSSPPSAARWTGSALVQVMACHIIGAKPLPEPMLIYCPLNP